MTQPRAQAQSTIRQVRAELAARLALIGGSGKRRRPGEIAAEVDQIRRIADRHGLYPAVAVSHALGGALARGDGGTLIQGWLAILGDAIGCDRQDPEACEAFVAACSVRLSA